YLDEYTFRCNRRSSKKRGLLFYRLIEQALMVDHTPYERLLAPNHKGRYVGDTRISQRRRSRSGVLALQ
ncbi:MAG TPA: hypothetical protein VHS06_09180, partial [Chloroflexota bacterium]|nr:hypothetical protein [Chloroflexota bacterium]